MTKRFLALVAAAALVVGAAARGDAATLVLYDDGNDNIFSPGDLVAATWTLTVAEACTTCAVSLNVVFTPTSTYALNPYYASSKYLDSVDFSLPGNVVSTISENPSLSDWSWAIGKLSGGGGCGETANNSGCGEWVGGSPTAGLLVTDGLNFTWNLLVSFETPGKDPVPALVDLSGGGNIRASFSGVSGTNVRTWSPADGSFDGGTTDGGSADGGAGAPEPGVLLLLGTGLVVAGARLRKRQ